MTVIMIYESVILKPQHEGDYKTDHEGLSETITSARMLQNPLNGFFFEPSAAGAEETARIPVYTEAALALRS